MNKGQTTLNARLTADVDLGSDINIVDSYLSPYSGTFDGQGHTLTVNWNSTIVNIAPFSGVKDATIKNLHVKGQITIDDGNLSGLILYAYGKISVSGCVIDVDLKVPRYLSGMIYTVPTGAQVTITDCVVKCDITATTDTNRAKMGGFVCSLYGNCTLNNCLYAGTNNGIDNYYTYTFVPRTYLDPRVTLDNCYYLNACGEEQGTQVTKAQLESGEVAYKLQVGRSENVWGQKLGTDNEPMLTAEAERHVYMVGFAYNGEVKATRYANKGGHVSLPTLQEALGTDYNPHHYYTGFAFANGFNETTPVEGNMTVAVTVNEKDCYEIGSKEDWKTFCDLVNDGQAGLDAKLMQNVDLGTEIVMVGTDIYGYEGTFDGQGHTLKLNWTITNNNYFAPFQNVFGATIKNLHTQGQITSGGGYLSGLIGTISEASTVSGCVSEVNLTSNADADNCIFAGMVGDISPSTSATFTD